MAVLVLLRHGESEWNLANRFTGWVDVDLSTRGEDEARHAGELMREQNVLPDVLHSSLQKRAIRTAELALAALDRLWIPVKRSWRLNERHYGALQGLDKKETAEQFGADQVLAWRRWYATPPPPLDRPGLVAQRDDPRYAALPDDTLPASECLADVVERVLPYWYDEITADLATGKTVLVGAHGNSLRALVKHLDAIADDDIVELNIPTGIPLVYEIDGHGHAQSSRYLDPEAAAAGADAVARQAG